MNVQPLRQRAAIVPGPLSHSCIPSQDELRAEAYEFVRLHFRADGRPYAAMDKNLLLERVTAFLMQRAEVSADTASTLAAHAICEYLSTQARVAIDIDRSTAYGIVVIDRATNSKRIVSAFEISQLLTAQALLAGTATPH
ncbi:hypothetical protein AKI39_03110 [Bordetella sp. H567]|uniref:hypothetical protein n=1 Tax=Bordetella sp. H567 TaxID=1697043 RepID=UPI00081CA687|nr:hypothetical protein [Bordetella sp. H567]AOB29895.1 hypothetical protein AKI39_03110 [Bordetella sp. H567]